MNLLLLYIPLLDALLTVHYDELILAHLDNVDDLLSIVCMLHYQLEFLVVENAIIFSIDAQHIVTYKVQFRELKLDRCSQFQCGCLRIQSKYGNLLRSNGIQPVKSVQLHVIVVTLDCGLGYSLQCMRVDAYRGHMLRFLEHLVDLSLLFRRNNEKQSIVCVEFSYRSFGHFYLRHLLLLLFCEWAPGEQVRFLLLSLFGGADEPDSFLFDWDDRLNLNLVVSIFDLFGCHHCISSDVNELKSMMESQRLLRFVEDLNH